MLHFENPYYLLALALLLPLMIFIYRSNRRFVRQAQAQFADLPRPSWLDGYRLGLAYRRTVLFGLAGILLMITLANPRLGLRSQTVQRRGIDVFLAIDVSRSMRAQDLKPSRMERAKQLAFQILEEFRGDRVGIIFFAGKAFLQMPLTTDYSSAELFIRTASPDWDIQQGTAMEEAIDLINKLYQADNQRERALIFLTDGENHEERAVQAAEEARQQGTYTFVIGIGTTQGAEIPDPQTAGRVLDKNNQVVLSRLNEDLMKRIAQAGGGIFVSAVQGRNALRELREHTQKIQAQAFQDEQFDVFETYYQWFLGPAILLLLLEYLLNHRFNKTKPSKP